ncbi:hypothetical protein EZ449_04215 [Pedobacter frigidisoli]|uniref:DUF6597 domain-containing protein n=1 Tax=Pedobacter frigidisoli TaxID=2530455 RepID=A0A4R0P5P0_9SPHI|nr:DUF6597 domain-containing transcriptional factor [Pedobacter frigidisoli]TCD12221.1 hypothetical protein EZ449_04215 [Pedobacter frigidisoli]
MPINYLKKIQLGEFNEDGYRINPPQEIESVIEGFYVFSKKADNDMHLLFNDGFPALVFLQNREDTVSVTTESDSFEIKSAWANAGSIKNVYVKYNHNTSQVFIVRFFPSAFYKLFGLTAQYFRSNSVIPFEAAAKGANFNVNEFFECSSILERVSFFKSYVQNSPAEVEQPQMLYKTLAYINKIKGNSTVLDIPTYTTPPIPRHSTPVIPSQSTPVFV